MDEKITLVDTHRTEQGLNACLQALNVSKGTWHYRMSGGSKAAEKRARDEALKEPIVEIITANPAYGYRRIKPDPWRCSRPTSPSSATPVAAERPG